MDSATGEQPQGFLRQFGLFLARFCPSAWIGAATLFVIVGVTEVTRGGFDSTTKDQLVSVRFPAFYLCGTALVTAGMLGTWLAGNSVVFPILRRFGAFISLTLVLILMVVDYGWIYTPLAKMVTPPGQVKPSGFANYHEASNASILQGWEFVW